MKVAISAKGANIDSKMDGRFGRCNYFVLFDDKTKQIDSVINPASNASSGSGPAAARELAKHNVQAVITGHVGDIAQHSLQTSGIKIITLEVSTVQEALDLYLKSKRKSIKYQ